MCTAISMIAKNGDVVMGRTMDFSYQLQPKLYELPAGNEFIGQAYGQVYTSKYSVIGIGQDISPLTFADGANNVGLGAAALYFPAYAEYDSGDKLHGRAVASTDVILYVLSMCRDASEVVSFFQGASIVGAADRITGAVAPLHWMFLDVSGKCVVVEKTIEGTFCHENPIGVLANSPDFGWHMTNLRNYAGVLPEQKENAVWGGDISLTPFGQGGGTWSLPGDFTSPGRFVRTAWLKTHTVDLADSSAAIRAGFQILGNVSIPKGCVVTERGTYDYTQYTVFYDLENYEVHMASNA